MVLARKQMQRRMEHNKDSKNKSTQVQPSDLQQRRQKRTPEKRELLHYMEMGKLDIYLQKIETRTVSLSMYKKKVCCNKDLNIRSKTLELL
jgi:hypothetical protein